MKLRTESLAILILAGVLSAPALTAENTIKIEEKAAGKTMKRIGYSIPPIVEGDNLIEWLNYSNSNAVRYWVSPNRFVNGNNKNMDSKNIDYDKNVSNFETFEKKKNDLRNKMQKFQDETYIKWRAIDKNFEELYERGAYYTMANSLERLKGQKFDIAAELHNENYEYKNESEKWYKAWSNWQLFYAVAYKLAKDYDIYIFEAQNEPDLFLPRNSQRVNETEDIEKYIFQLQLFADAVRSAVEDVNMLYKKELKSSVYGPALASSGVSPLGLSIMENTRTDYAGRKTNHDIINYFGKHRYTKDPYSYETHVDEMTEMMKRLTANKKALPVVFTEFNYMTQNDWKNTDMTGDDFKAYQAQAIAWANLMESKVPDAYQFRYTTAHRGTNVNILHYSYDRPRDLSGNLLYNSRIAASSNQKDAVKVRDGLMTDDSSWVAEGKGPHSIEFQFEKPEVIKSYIIDIGDADYDRKAKAYTGIYKDFALQYWDGNKWVNFEGTDTAPAEGVLNKKVYNLAASVKTSKVRFYSNEENPVKVRELYVSSENIIFEIGGPVKSAEVTRLFAEGFKDERPLLKTTVTSDVKRYQAFTSYDNKTGNYNIWLPYSYDNKDLPLTIDMTATSVQKGSLITIKEVSGNNYGNVVYSKPLEESKKIEVIQPKNSVWLITIHKNPVKSKTSSIQENIQMNLGTEKVVSGDKMVVRQNTIEKNKNSFGVLKFENPNSPKVRKAFLNVSGKVEGAIEGYVTVYALKNNNWKLEDKLTPENFNVNKNASFIKNAIPVGQLQYDAKEEYKSIDVTETIKNSSSASISFVLIKEKRHPNEIKDEEFFIIDGKTSKNKPYLEVWE